MSFIHTGVFFGSIVLLLYSFMSYKRFIYRSKRKTMPSLCGVCWDKPSVSEGFNKGFHMCPDCISIQDQRDFMAMATASDTFLGFGLIVLVVGTIGVGMLLWGV